MTPEPSRRATFPPTRALAPLAVAMSPVLAAATIASGWRGAIGNDERGQLAQIAADRVNDWHSPLMTRAWQALIETGLGEGALFVLAALLYWGAFALIGWALVRRGAVIAALAVPVIGALVLAVLVDSLVTKDALLAALLLLGAGLLLAGGDTRAPRGAAVLATAAFLAGVLMRHNGAFALGPLLILAWRPRWIERAGVTIVVSVLVAALAIPVAGVINRRMLDAAPAGAIESLRLFDLAGIAAQEGTTAPFGPATRVTMRDVARCYTPVMWDTMAPWGRCPWFSGKAGVPIHDQLELARGAAPSPATLDAAWRRALLSYPGGYLLHRAEHANAELLLFVSIKPRNGIGPAVPDPAPPRESLAKALVRYTAGVVLIPAMFVAIGVVAWIVALAALRRGNGEWGTGERGRGERWPVRVAAALAASGLAYAASFVVVGVATAPRYFAYPAATALLAVALLLADPGVRRLWRVRRDLMLVTLLLPAAVMMVAEAGRLTVTVPQPLPVQPAS
ncbi:hypothetical protein COA17_05210 [Sphingomonas ginsenosidimutans]|jgi:hypothetical protein|uniref:Glycosyltransferase RgtA/B/C/D-like domain-containing protein n=1 Tax=Sphingomonas ginsenosidimutans TaxID=862134 RepID=A0A2A4I0Y0_9SPHN|nr:hypothetical protein [Sphingomonas ginsenosidimutans]PCG10772.1 hypothetical protein COA17_05210 [Sphingomonas ginsenosidimutans]